MFPHIYKLYQHFIENVNDTFKVVNTIQLKSNSMFQYLQPWHPSSRDAKLATVMRQVGQNEGLRSRMRRNFTFYHLCAVNILTATTCGRTLVYVHG